MPSLCRVVLATVGIGLGVTPAACSLDFATGARSPSEEEDAGIEAAAPDAFEADDAPLTEDSFGSLARWEILDLKSIPMTSLTSPGVGVGAVAFDGTFLYALPAGNNVVLRFDTRARLADLKGWTATTMKMPADVSTAMVCGDTLVFGTQGAALVGTYELAKPFASDAFQFFDVNGAKELTSGIGGGACGDDRVFLAAESGASVSHDLASSFATGWVSGASGSFRGAVRFDDGAGLARFLFVPPNKPPMAAVFSGISDWTMPLLDLTKVGVPNTTFEGGVWDGQYVYLASNASPTQVVRFASAGDVQLASTWQVSPRLNSGTMRSAVFDGRFVYFGPHDGTVVTRYDTRGPFSGDEAAASFKTFDILGVADAQAPSFARVAFDGAYVYFVPSKGTSIIARYRTDSTAMPTTWRGSFY